MPFHHNLVLSISLIIGLTLIPPQDVAARSLSGYGVRSEASEKYRPFFRSFETNSSDYLTKMTGEMGIFTIAAVESSKVRQAPRIIHLPAEYKTIQQAIDASLPGDEIRLAAGTYQENIFLKPGISIYGEDPDTTFITGSPLLFLPIVTMADECTLEGVSIKGAKAKSKGAILIETGSPHIKNCVITANQDSGILIKKGAAPVIWHNKIFKNRKSAIEIYNSTPNISANELFNNKGFGILIVNSTALTKKNRRLKNFPPGNSAQGNSNLAKPTIIGNTIKNNQAGEIMCRNVSPDILENTIINKRGRFIILFESDAVIKKNKIKSGGPPAIHIESGNPIIEGNIITGVLRFPILGESKAGSIKNNDVKTMREAMFEKQKTGHSPD